jgi:hypothetical protein
MPNFRVNVKTEHKGAVFNSSATKAAGARMVIKINDALAQEGVRRVKSRLGQVLQKPTGYYESRIQVDRRSTYRGITDGGVIYGGWLEGVSSRNKTTRFKGYHTFRMVQQGLAKDKEAIAKPYVDQYTQEMNR